MSDLVISNVIKVILIVVIVVGVGFMLYTVFKNDAINFFKGLALNNSQGIILPLVGAIA